MPREVLAIYMAVGIVLRSSESAATAVAPTQVHFVLHLAMEAAAVPRALIKLR